MKTPPMCACGRSLPVLDVPGTVFCCCGKVYAAGPGSRRNASLDPDEVFRRAGRSTPHQALDTRQGISEDVPGRLDG